jgi:hypothetical protein
MSNFCKHNIHTSIVCLQCQSERKDLNELLEDAEVIKKDDARKAAMRKIKKAAERLDW